MITTRMHHKLTERVRSPRSVPAGIVTAGIAVLSVLIGALVSSWIVERGAAGPAITEHEAIAAMADRHTRRIAALDSDSSQSDVARLKSEASGDWARQLDADPQGLLTALGAGGRSDEVYVDEIGIAEATSDTATVLATASSTIAKASDPASGDRATSYHRVLNLRLRLVQRHGSWTVSAVEVVA